jgi:hypothetical protein
MSLCFSDLHHGSKSMCYEACLSDVATVIPSTLRYADVSYSVSCAIAFTNLLNHCCVQTHTHYRHCCCTQQARAMLQRADILLLDEPTNHLDVINVAWVKNYINSLTHVTAIMVSHDSGFLNDCCTHILAIASLKLTSYKVHCSDHMLFCAVSVVCEKLHCAATVHSCSSVASYRCFV